MKKWIIVSVLLLFAVCTLIAPVLSAQKKGAGEPQAVCPVMGGKIDKEVYADYQGKRIYFCCEACKEVFQQDPDRYIQKLEDAGVGLEQSPQQR